MMEADAFWTTSGREDRFEFKVIAPYNLDIELGQLEGVTGGSLEFGYYTDLKVTGTLDFVSLKKPESCVVRVHYKPKLGTDDDRDIILCTCWATIQDLVFDKGRYSGTYELRGMLAKFLDDELFYTFTIGKDKTYKAELKRLITNMDGGRYSVHTDVKDKTCPEAKAFEAGESPMDVIQHIADALGGQVGVSNIGRLEISKYLVPAKRTCDFKLPSGQYSVVEPEVGFEDDFATLPNRVACRCEVSWKQTVYALDKNNNKQVYKSGDKKGQYKTKTEIKKKLVVGRAVVAKTSELHHSKRGRWVTKNYEYTWRLKAKGLNDTKALNDAIANVQANMNKRAASKLSSLTARSRSYEIACSYLPIEIGQVVEFEHVSSGLNLHVQAMVTAIDMEIGPRLPMKVTLKHVRYV